jgi:hypothetical protein
MAQSKEGLERIWVKRGTEWRLEEWTKKRLNEEYLDIGLTGHPHQVGFAINVYSKEGLADDFSVIKKMGLVKRWKMRLIGWRGFLPRMRQSSNVRLFFRNQPLPPSSSIGEGISRDSGAMEI